jgi:heat shock protein HtpX
MVRSGWLAARALIAIALMVGFYVLALSIAVGLFYIAYAQLQHADRADLRIFFFCIIGGGTILASIVPRRVPFVAPGPELLPAEQPRLFKELIPLSESVGEPMPSEVYLASDLNAWVAEVRGDVGFSSKRVMGIGLPLLQVLTVSEFKAVLAHEFGHYHGGDTRLGPWIYKTRMAIGRTIQSLTEQSRGHDFMRLLRWPFLSYAKMFLRITHAISRAQELSADHLAAATVGAEALAKGLRSIHYASAASDYFLNQEVLPVVRSGFFPPLVQGFSALLRNESIVKTMEENLRNQLASSRSDPYDTHPPLAQRLAALAHMPNGKEMDNSPALSLIDNLEQMEARLVSSWLPPRAARLKPIQWADTGPAVLLPVWRKLADQRAAELKGLTLEQLHSVASKLNAFAAKLNLWQPGVPLDAIRQYASTVLGSAVACALYDAGWKIETEPGVLWLTHDGARLNPFDAVNRIASGKLPAKEWTEMIASCRLDPSVPLASPERSSADLQADE